MMMMIIMIIILTIIMISIIVIIVGAEFGRVDHALILLLSKRNAGEG